MTCLVQYNTVWYGTNVIPVLRTGSNLNSLPRRSMEPSNLSITASTEVEADRAAGRELVKALAPVARARIAAAVFMVQMMQEMLIQYRKFPNRALEVDPLDSLCPGRISTRVSIHAHS